MINEELINTLQGLAEADTGCHAIYVHGNGQHGRILAEGGHIMDARFETLLDTAALQAMLHQENLQVTTQEWTDDPKATTDIEIMHFLISYLIQLEHATEQSEAIFADHSDLKSTTSIGNMEHYDLMLELVGAGLDGRTYYLHEGVNLLGSSDRCHIRIPDGTISRNHLEILVEKYQVIIQDLGSTNGTLVNGVPVERAHLRPGDRIVLGDVELVYHVSLKRASGHAGACDYGTRWQVDQTRLIGHTKKATTMALDWRQFAKKEPKKNSSQLKKVMTLMLPGLPK